MAALAIAPLDTDLMLRVQAGDEASFSLLLDRYRGPVNRFLYRMVENQAVAEELAQEVFLRVYRARPTYQPTAKFSAWLFCIATRQALNWRRDYRREFGRESLEGDQREGGGRQWPDRKPSIEQTLIRRVTAAEIRRAVQRLPEKQRAAVLMHKYHDLGYSQIARTLGCSESAVKSLLFRAYSHLRASLGHLAKAA